MKIQDLKNYGIGLSRQLSSLPQKEKHETQKLGAQIISKQLGIIRFLKFLVFYQFEKARLSKIDLSAVREKGLNDEQFIEEQIKLGAVSSAIKKIAGLDTANIVIQEMSHEIGAKTLGIVMPKPEDFLKFDEPFSAFKEYLISIARGDNDEGCHIVKVVEDTDSVFQMDIEYCAWHEIYKRLGIKEACFLSCNSDDILLPQYLEPLGIEFKRTNTISQGAAYCDFRFVKSRSSKKEILTTASS